MNLKLRLPHWTDCYFVLRDVGRDFVFGTIHKGDGTIVAGTPDNATPQMMAAFALDLPWQPYEAEDALTVISKLPVRGER